MPLICLHLSNKRSWCWQCFHWTFMYFYQLFFLLHHVFLYLTLPSIHYHCVSVHYFMWFTTVSCISPVFMYVQWWERCLCPDLSMRYSNCMSSALKGPHLLYISWQGRTCSQESSCIQCHSSDEEQWQQFSTRRLTIFISRITCSPLSFPSKASGSWDRESSDFKRQAESSAFWEDGKSIKSCHCPPVLSQIYLTYPHVTPTKVSYQEPAGGQHGPISTSASLMLQFSLQVPHCVLVVEAV